MNFTNEEIELIKDLICDWGSDCPGADSKQVELLGQKLGVIEVRSEEEIEHERKRAEEFANSDAGKQIAAMMTLSNGYIDDLIKRQFDDKNLFNGKVLKITVSNDYNLQWKNK